MLHLSSREKKEELHFQSFGASQGYYIKAYAKKEAMFAEVNWYIFFDSNVHLEN